MVAPPHLLRFRPSKTHSRFIKYAWRPPSSVAQSEWTLYALDHLRHSPLLPPDGYLPLSILTRSHEPRTILTWAHHDRLHRLETEFRLESAGHPKNPQVVPYIRARTGHSIPDVRTSNVRIRFAYSIPSLIYATSPANWPLIEHQGIRPSLSPLLVPKPSNPNFIYFAHYMADITPPAPARNAVQLHIGIDVSAAMRAGIKFYATSTNQIISTGLANTHMPKQFFKDVSVVSIKSQQLHGFAEPVPPEQGGPGLAKLADVT